MAMMRGSSRSSFWTSLLIAGGIAVVVGFASFSVYQLVELREQQTQLEELTEDLCTTLERAGILIRGSSDNPCERRPSP